MATTLELRGVLQDGRRAGTVDLATPAGAWLGVVSAGARDGRRLLRQMAGLDPLSRGSVVVGARDVSDLPAGRRGVGLVFSGGALYPDRDVSSNLWFGPRVRREPRDEARRRIEAEVVRWDLASLLGRRPHELSPLERVRAALARALVDEPRLILLDDVLAGLSAGDRLAGRALVTAGLREAGALVVWSTSDAAEAGAVCDVLALVAGDRLLQAGTWGQLSSAPSNRAAAELVGVGWTFLDRAETGAGVRVAGLQLPVPQTASGGVCVGIPFDAVYWTTWPGLTAVQARVLVAPPPGAGAVALMQVDGERWQVRADPVRCPPPGSWVTLYLDPRRWRFFEREGLGGALDVDLGAIPVPESVPETEESPPPEVPIPAPRAASEVARPARETKKTGILSSLLRTERPTAVSGRARVGVGRKDASAASVSPEVLPSAPAESEPPASPSAEPESPAPARSPLTVTTATATATMESGTAPLPIEWLELAPADARAPDALDIRLLEQPTESAPVPDPGSGMLPLEVFPQEVVLQRGVRVRSRWAEEAGPTGPVAGVHSDTVLPVRAFSLEAVGGVLVDATPDDPPPAHLPQARA